MVSNSHLKIYLYSALSGLVINGNDATELQPQTFGMKTHVSNLFSGVCFLDFGHIV